MNNNYFCWKLVDLQADLSRISVKHHSLGATTGGLVFILFLDIQKY